MPTTLLLTILAMVAFAANSLLARAALSGGGIDATGFTAIRLISGAIVLAALVMARGSRTMLRHPPGNFPSALALLAYALGFSLAYLRLGAATGALVLFTAVQGTMITWGMLRRDRPTAPELTGLAIAFTAFVYLVLPGLGTPDAIGFALMIAAGISWGIYSLRGSGSDGPLPATAGNFVRAALLCTPLIWLAGPMSPWGIGLAVISGVVTSGFGYAIWYQTLPRLSTTQAATVQLTVPIIAAFGAIAVLSEPLTTRLVIASTCILGGVALTILSRSPQALKAASSSQSRPSQPHQGSPRP